MYNHAGKCSWRALLLAFATVLLPLAVSAQTGSITGRVTDQNGSAVQSAQVSVVGTRLGVLTDVDGRYVLRNLSPGSLQLRVDYPGFDVTLVSVAVAASDMITQDVQLVGQPIALGGGRRVRDPKRATHHRSARNRLGDLPPGPGEFSREFVGTRAQGSEGARLHSGRHDRHHHKRARIQLVVQQPVTLDACPTFKRWSSAHFMHPPRRPYF